MLALRAASGQAVEVSRLSPRPNKVIDSATGRQ
jgi:hypothetical protein